MCIRDRDMSECYQEVEPSIFIVTLRNFLTNRMKLLVYHSANLSSSVDVLDVISDRKTGDIFKTAEFLCLLYLQNCKE